MTFFCLSCGALWAQPAEKEDNQQQLSVNVRAPEASEFNPLSAFSGKLSVLWSEVSGAASDAREVITDIHSSLQVPAELSQAESPSAEGPAVVKPLGTKPAVKAAQPATKAAKPAVKAAQPATKAAKPAAKASQPATKAAKPAVKASQPATKAAKPAAKASQPATKATEPPVKPAPPTTSSSDSDAPDLAPNASIVDENITDGRGAVEQMERSVTGTSKFDIDQVTRSFTLRSSIDTAMRQNPELRVADENVVQANAQYGQVKSQKNIKFVVGNKTTWQNRQTSGPMVTVEPLTNQLQASLKTLLTTFGRLENDIAASYLNIGVEAINAMTTRHQLCYRVKQAFSNRLKADSSVDVAQLNLNVNKESLADTKRLFARGVMARYDVIQSDLQVTEAEEQLARAKSQVEQANAEFLKLLGEQRSSTDMQEGKISLVSPEPIEVDPACTLPDLQDLAKARRFEVVSVDRSMEMVKKLRLSADRENMPEVSLSADYIFSPGYRTYPCSMYQLNLSVNWQAWDGGYRKAKLQEIDSQLRALEASREDLCNNIDLDVQNAWINFKLTDVTLATAKKRVEAAWVYHDMARQRFINGLGTSLEVSDALKSLNDARQAFVVACSDRDLAFAALEYSVGVDFPHRRLAVTSDMFKVEE